MTQLIERIFDAIVRNLLRLFGTSYAVVQLLQDGLIHMAALDGESLGPSCALRDRQPP